MGYTNSDMATKEIIISLPNPNLHKRSNKVGLITKEIQHIIEEMKSATLDWEASRPHEVGVALAAIQVDQPWRIIVIRNNFEDRADQTFSVFINPVITKLEGDIEEDFEGCLSVTDIYGKVPRHTKIRLRAIDEHGHEIRIKAQDFLARVLQHEVDHINGIMFVDHIKNKPNAFFKITENGELTKVAYEQVKQSGIFRD